MSTTYATLVGVLAIPVCASVGIAGAVLRGSERRRWLLSVLGSTLVLVLLTAVFDALMIEVGLVAYDPARISGVMVGPVPVEDFSYAVAAAVLAPTIWALTFRDRPAITRRVDADPALPVPPNRGLVRTLLAASRPVSWIDTAAPFALAYLLAHGSVDLTWIVGVLFFLVPYNLAMYGINDVFDYESDLRNPRKGGIEGAVLAPEAHRATLVAAALACLPFVAYLVTVGTATSTVWLTASLLAVVAYSVRGLRFKEVPVLDSLTSAFHFASPAAVGWTAAGERIDGTVWVCLGAFLLWGAASHAFGAVQDVRWDRAAGIASVATVLGARATVWAAFCGYAAAGLLLALAAPFPASGAAVVALPYLAVVGAHLGVTDADAERANVGWRRFLLLNMLAGFLVTQLVLWQVLVWEPAAS